MGITQSVETLWSVGAQGQTPRRARQITLVNQVGLFASVATLPYQLFYLATNPRHYLPVLLANVVFISSYLSVLPLNRAGRFDAARNTVLGTVYTQLFVVTSLISNGAGVHLFYFPLGATLGLFFITGRSIVSFLLVGLASALFIVCQAAFAPGTTLLAVPGPILGVMYNGSAVGAMLFSGIFAFLFSRDMDQAELALTHANAELERISGLDPLTGLANRRTLDAHLEREWARLRRQRQCISLLLSDVDCFKSYNDHYGHLAGDACLQKVANVLSGIARRAPDLVARYGGEEFIIVLPATGSAGAAAVAERARASVEALALPHERSSASAVITVSAGVVCVYPHEIADPQELLRQADAALYAAKRDGRNRVVVFEPAPASPG